MVAMKRGVFSIVLFALLADLCVAEIVVNNEGQQHLDRLSRAAVDIAMTCYGDPGSAVGIVGDTDGSILMVLRRNHFIPVILINGSAKHFVQSGVVGLRKLQVFVIALHSPIEIMGVLFEIERYVWWNQYANFLIVDMRPEASQQCGGIQHVMFTTIMLGILNVQFICMAQLPQEKLILIWTSNPFVRKAPEVWAFTQESKFKTKELIMTSFLFVRRYREGGQSCESINFKKTSNVGGYPLRFVTPIPPSFFESDDKYDEMTSNFTSKQKKLYKLMLTGNRWFVNNIVNAMNASRDIANVQPHFMPGVWLRAHFFSTFPNLTARNNDRIILPLNQVSLFAVTQHTNHMTQLDKILSVIDRKSRIGMWVVYLITFMFFKFFLRQPVVPALLNIVRLTCNTGLTTLPQNVAPTLYLTSLLMFVVTLQAIYTGNLATLLTTVIPYPNVQRREDVAKLGYKIILQENESTKLSGDPVFDGCIIEVPVLANCVTYVLNDPLTACIMDPGRATGEAALYKLHVSQDPMVHEYAFYITTMPNMFQRRIEEILMTLFEAGLYYSYEVYERLRIEHIDDDDVKGNIVRRVMTFEDLRFAFIILGIGLLCSLISFIGEVAISRIRWKYAKRRDRVRRRSAWGVTPKKLSLFPSLRCRFNLRQLFPNRH